MVVIDPPPADIALNLALAIIDSSNAPLLLLDDQLIVIAASLSFCTAFDINPARCAGGTIFALGEGEWNTPRLRSLLGATVSGSADIAAYEMDLVSERQGTRRLVLNAHRLIYGVGEPVRLLLSVADVTDARLAAKHKDDLLREKTVLLQEIQHRVANSLQIIASVLMQSARKVQSEETRGHLKDAHNRVMSVAALQRQLATDALGEVELRPYLTQLCVSIGASMIRSDQSVTLVVRADASVVNADVSVSLGLVVTELVINALKHAFPDDRAGAITVDYAAHGPDWQLTIADNGVGMQTGPDRPKAGLGTSIVEALARQLRAQIEVTDRKPGTAVSVSHKLMASANDEDIEPTVQAI